jgi:hypothetical protein
VSEHRIPLDDRESEPDDPLTQPEQSREGPPDEPAQTRDEEEPSG